ncbi:MAG: hypothetical protein R3E48_19625 [Burkholderiaceae bacterium]
MLKNKLRAGGVHLLISATVVAVVVVLAWRVWYPGYLSIAAGMLTMIGILAAVDIVLGPVCTFIVYRPGKQSLRFDLAVIAGVQLLALAYGVHAIYVARPAYIVFAIDRFEVVSAAELEPRQLKLASPEFRGLPRTGPRLVAARLPGDREERNALLFRRRSTAQGLARCLATTSRIGKSAREVSRSRRRSIGSRSSTMPLQSSARWQASDDRGIRSGTSP